MLICQLCRRLFQAQVASEGDIVLGDAKKVRESVNVCFQRLVLDHAFHSFPESEMLLEGRLSDYAESSN